jgi:diketogulonate reductase-like aldo/keto reductase
MKNPTDDDDTTIDRRTFLKALAALGLGGSALFDVSAAVTKNRILKKIPSSGEQLPVIGLGTSRTFDALGDPALMARLKLVLQAFFDSGGTLIDSSPMYGTAQAVTGKLLKQVKGSDRLFAATKVWVNGKQNGIKQMEASRKLWGIKRFDLMQIHNLRDWRVHYETLTKMKAEGNIRYTGITTSHGRYHDELEELLKSRHFDFLQLSYNIANRDVESKLLPIARDKGIAVIVNRPFQRGSLFRQVRGKALPGFAKDLDIHSWGQFFLKYVVSHPAITCTIPATSKVKHMLDNMGALIGHLPDTKQRQEMLSYFNSIG